MPRPCASPDCQLDQALRQGAALHLSSRLTKANLRNNRAKPRVPFPGTWKIKTKAQRISVDVRQRTPCRQQPQIRVVYLNIGRLAQLKRDSGKIGARQGGRSYWLLPCQFLCADLPHTTDSRACLQEQQLLRQGQVALPASSYHQSPKNVFAGTVVDAATFDVVSPIRGAIESRPDWRPSDTALTRLPRTRPVTPEPNERSMFNDTRS